MKKLILIMAMVIPILANGQIDFGKYRLCFEMYWKCHTMIILDLNEDKTYKFRLQDDVSIEESFGTWEINDSLIVLNPKTIPDTIQTSIFETKLSNSAKKYWWDLSSETTKSETDNLLVINNYFNPAKNKQIWIRQSGEWKEKVTDEFGCIFYSGEIAESVRFQVNNREFELSTTKDEIPSMIRITIKEDFKDLVYRTLIFNYIRIEKNEMFVDVAEEGKEVKRLYFEKIKNKN
jgi:hypothetical protein